MVLPEGDGVTIKVQTSKRDVCYLWHQMLKLKHGPTAVLTALPPQACVQLSSKLCGPPAKTKPRVPRSPTETLPESHAEA